MFAEPELLAHGQTEFNGMRITRIARLEELPAEDVVAALVSDPWGSGAIGELTKLLTKECGAVLRITNSGGRYVEIAHPEATKLHAMEKLCKQLGVGVEKVMAIGDNFNDLEMLAGCGVGVAVANSPPGVKDVCRFVCQQNAARGVVEALMTVVSAYRHESRRILVDRGRG